jgi:ribosomal-protein-alanine N-acetyltransferase
MAGASEGMPILTRRLLLRVPVRADAARMLAYVKENRAHLEPWEPLRPDSYYTLRYWKADVASAQEELRQGTALRLALLFRDDPSGPVVGVANFRNVVRGAFQACTLGYSLDHRHQGRGLMGEALEAATGFLFGAWGLHRIMANYIPRNERSGRLLERLGFVREGYAKGYLRIAGVWEDHVMTALVNPEEAETEGG